MDDLPNTPRACEACGGRSCKWCTDGFQSVEQQSSWRKFRTEMRKISSTYSMLEKITQELIDRLQEIGTEEAIELSNKGKKALNDWISALAETKERREASIEIAIFQNEAITIMMKWRQRVE